MRIPSMLGIQTVGIVGLVCLAIGSAGGGIVMGTLKDAKIAKIEAAHARAQAKAVSDALARVQAQSAITAEVGQQAAQTQVRIETRYRTLREKVRVYVPTVTAPGVIRADDRVPVGALVLLDAAARGDSDDAISVTAGQSYDLASDLRFTELVGGYVDNLGIGQANRQTLMSLQDWNRRQAAVDH